MILLDTDIISASMRTGPDMDVTRWMHGNRGIASPIEGAKCFDHPCRAFSSRRRAWSIGSV